MYFSKMEFTPKGEANEVATRESEAVVRLALKKFRVTLDGEPDSIKHVDRILDEIYRSTSRRLFRVTGDNARELGRKFGTYFGEVVREEFGGNWGTVRIFNEKAVSLSIGPKAIDINPWNWAVERSTTGSGKTLWEWYETVCRSIHPVGIQGAADGDVSQTGAFPVWEDRLFRLREDQGYFETGTTSDGRQVMFEGSTNGFVAIVFGADGNLLGFEEYPKSSQSESEPGSSVQLNPNSIDLTIESGIDKWKSEIGFASKPILVHRFSVPELGIGIDEYPDYLERFLVAPELYEPDENERNEKYESVREWDEAGNFVLYWENDLFMNADGEVESS